MKKETLEKANDINNKLNAIGILSEMFTEEYIPAVLDLRSADRSCSYRRVKKSELPKELLQDIFDVIAKYYVAYEKELESL